MQEDMLSTNWHKVPSIPEIGPKATRMATGGKISSINSFNSPN
jgi:hypothetical protein